MEERKQDFSENNLMNFQKNIREKMYTKFSPTVLDGWHM